MTVTVVVKDPARARELQRNGLRCVSPDQAEGETGVIVNWAGLREYHGVWRAALVLNRPEAVRLAASPDVREEIWSYHGLRVGRRRGGERYRVHVFDLRPVAVFVLGRGRRRRARRVYRWNSKKTLWIVQTAVQAVYALRLDFAAVDLVLGKSGAMIVDLHWVLPTRGPLVAVYADSIRQFLKRWAQPAGDVRIGADPEFVICDRQQLRLVISSRHLPREGAVGVDNQRLRGTRTARPIVELRPNPAREPAVLVNEIRHLLRQMPAPLCKPRLGWYAGSGPVAGYPIGGHVHLSGVPLTGPLVRALDCYLALPFLLIEDHAKARRRRQRYGLLGEVREKPWGFEYRTLPSWLVAPRFALAALCLTKLVAWNWRRLQRDVFLSPEVIRAFYRCDKATLYPYFDVLWADLSVLPGYEAYAEDLAVLPTLIQRRMRWSEGRDFRRQWGVLAIRRRGVVVSRRTPFRKGS